MRLAASAALALSAGLILHAAAARAQTVTPTVLAKAAVDTSIYRDGEVRRTNEMHGRWSLDCDEVVRLGQRFCSLRSLAVDPAGVAVARITISTDDKGHPAALFDLPLAIDLRQPVLVTADQALVVGKPTKTLLGDTRRLLASETARSQRKGAKAMVTTDLLTAKLFPTICDAAGCHAVWPLTPGDIGALRAGAGLRLKFAAPVAMPSAMALGLSGASRAVEASVSSAGFDAALTASLK